jgi:transcriptional regulator with PAS, ATPase and Fis domain
MVTEVLDQVLHESATSRGPELLMDEGRGRAHVKTPLEGPRLMCRAIGNSFGWRHVLKAARRVASTKTTVCLNGESRTGKEVVIRFTHAVSPRTRGPFVAINCAALPEQLLESQLFGFQRGAFTDAHHPKPGQMVLATAGVLFVDEISEIEVTTDARELLLAYDWPGNVRELRNVLERATIVCEDGLIRAEDLPIAGAPDRAEENSTDLAVVEQRTIERVMGETTGNKARTAQQLGVPRTQLYVRVRK